MGWLGLLTWIVIGLITGLLASQMIPHHVGIVGDIVVGVAGAVIGGFLFSQFSAAGATGFSMWSILVAFVEAVILLVMIRTFSGRWWTRT